MKIQKIQNNTVMGKRFVVICLEEDNEVAKVDDGVITKSVTSMPSISIRFLFLLVVGVMGSLGLDVSSLPSAEDVQQRVNERYDSLFHVTKDGERLAKVCTICDEFLIEPDDVCSVTISKMRKMQNVLSWKKFPDKRRSREIEEYFSFKVRNDGCNTNLGFLKGMALSPHGLLTRVATKGRDQYQSTTCKRCKGCVSKESIPRMQF